MKLRSISPRIVKLSHATGWLQNYKLKYRERHVAFSPIKKSFHAIPPPLSPSLAPEGLNVSSIRSKVRRGGGRESVRRKLSAARGSCVPRNFVGRGKRTTSRIACRIWDNSHENWPAKFPTHSARSARARNLDAPGKWINSSLANYASLPTSRAPTRQTRG